MVKVAAAVGSGSRVLIMEQIHILKYLPTATATCHCHYSGMHDLYHLFFRQASNANSLKPIKVKNHLPIPRLLFNNYRQQRRFTVLLHDYENER